MLSSHLIGRNTKRAEPAPRRATPARLGHPFLIEGTVWATRPKPMTVRHMSVRLLILLLISVANAAPNGPNSPRDSNLNVTVARFEVVDGTMLDALAKLSAESIPFAFGFEQILKGKFSDPAPAEVRFSLKMDRKSVRQIVEALCARDHRYTWSRDLDTINIYPRNVINDHDYFLNYKIDRVEVRAAPNPDQALWAIVGKLPGPKRPIGYVQMGGDQSYPEMWTATFQNLTARAAINRISAHMGPRTFWIFFGATDYQAFTFQKGVFNTAGTQVPAGMK
jgi:hypothetical protein